MAKYFILSLFQIPRIMAGEESVIDFLRGICSEQRLFRPVTFLVRKPFEFVVSIHVHE